MVPLQDLGSPRAVFARLLPQRTAEGLGRLFALRLRAAVKTQPRLEVITYGEFNQVSHYTENVSAAH